jgi:hypothetical protein
MIFFLKSLLIINLAYFASIGVLHYLAIKKGDRERKAPFLRKWNSNYHPIFEYTGEFCLPAFSVRATKNDCEDGRHIVFQIYWIFGKLFLHTPIKPFFAGEWGFALADINSDGWQITILKLGKKGTGASRDDRWIMYDMPWTFSHYQTSYLVKSPKDQVIFWLDSPAKGSIQVDRYGKTFESYDYKEVHPYLYILKDGTAQHRYATIRQEKRLWRRRCLPFTNLFCLRNHIISIDFDQEVGERAKSWKGGTMGCSFAMLPGETGLQALRRMEATRRFDR